MHVAQYAAHMGCLAEQTKEVEEAAEKKMNECARV